MKSSDWLEKNGVGLVGNQTDYFERVGYKATWSIGDRVQGTWNRIPFRGTVGNDRQLNLIEGPRVSVHLDLPIKLDGQVHNFIFVKPKELKEFK
jgi:hypothetical protein